jgi:hypothetical protein
MENLRTYKAEAEARSAARREQEQREDQELQEALRAVEEFEREEALKAELLRQELERIAAQRRIFEAERRRVREAARQAELEAKHAELDKVLTELNRLQQTVLVYSQDRAREEARTRSEQARKELVEKQGTQVAELEAGLATAVAKMQEEWNRDYRARVIAEKQLEADYRAELEKYWSKRPNGEVQMQAALRKYMRCNDERFRAYKQWQDDELERLKYQLGDEVCIREELLESIRLRFTEELATEELELRRKLKAERKWFEVVVQERLRLLEESKEVDRLAMYESASGEESEVDEEWFDFDVDTPDPGTPGLAVTTDNTGFQLQDLMAGQA